MHNATIFSETADDDTLGGRISLARDVAALSVEETASIVGVETETWTNWENDRAAPRSNRLEMLAGVLQVSVAWMLSGRGRGPRTAPEAGEFLHTAVSRSAVAERQRKALLSRAQAKSGVRTLAPSRPKLDI